MKLKLAIILSILVLILSISPVLSFYDWHQYCNSFTPCQQSAFLSARGRLDLGYSNITLPMGYNVISASGLPFQALISSLGITPITANDIFTIVPDKNNLTIWNGTYGLVASIDTKGNIFTQIDNLDFWGNGESDIAGIWEVDGNTTAFRVYSFNITTRTLSKTYEMNFTTAWRGVNVGLRHSAGIVNFMVTYNPITSYSFTFYRIDKTGILTQQNYSATNCAFSEPFAFADFNDDGATDYMTYCGSSAMIFEENGSILYQFNSSNIVDAKMVHVDSSNRWKLAILTSEQHYVYPDGYASSSVLYIKNLDGTTFWSKSMDIGGQAGRLAVDDDYDGDYFNDIYLLTNGYHFTTHDNNFISMQIFSGHNGTILASKIVGDTGWCAIATSGATALTIANLDGDNHKEFIFSGTNRLWVWNAYNNVSYILFYTSEKRISSCIPADANYDGLLELTCSGIDETTMLSSSNFSNVNAQIDLVVLSPSNVILPNQLLTATIFASDNESNTPFTYEKSCYDGAGFSDINTNNVKNCTYYFNGLYNLTLGVRDVYHTDFTLYSTIINVTTEAGAGVCNNNGTCDYGETYANCPADCPAPPTPNGTTQATDTGGMPLPTKIVDVNNVEQGFLPEIYYGTLAFLSNALTPIMIVIFAILFALIILSLGSIIIKVAKKIES
jgi:hypothetical protein